MAKILVKRGTAAQLATAAAANALLQGEPYLVTDENRLAVGLGVSSFLRAVMEGDARLSDARDWTAAVPSQAEAEAGTSTTERKWTAQRIAQAIAALAPGATPPAWGTITGTLSAQTDLQNALNGKAADVDVVKLAGDQTITGDKKFSSILRVTGNSYWQVSDVDVALQRADARDDATNFARMHWYGLTDAGATSNFRHAWYDGAAYVNVTAASGAVTFGGGLIANTFNGLPIGTGVNNGANQIVRTNASGYCDFGWINTISGVASAAPPARIYCSQDAYVRYMTAADFARQLPVNVAVLNASTTLSAATYQNNIIYNTTSGITFTLSNTPPIGTQWQFHNRSAGNITIATGGNTVYWMDGGGAAPGTGNRTLARAGVATVVKIASAVFHIYGGGLS